MTGDRARKFISTKAAVLNSTVTKIRFSAERIPRRSLGWVKGKITDRKITKSIQGFPSRSKDCHLENIEGRVDAGHL